MSDPQDIPGRREPPRAEPLQPDRPASGNEVEPDTGDAADGGDAASAERQKTQSDRALKNVREGYG